MAKPFCITGKLGWTRFGSPPHEYYLAAREGTHYRVRFGQGWWIAEWRPGDEPFNTWNEVGNYRDPKTALEACGAREN